MRAGPLTSREGMPIMDAGQPGRAGPPRAGYPRSAGSARGEARRRELLDRVCADLADRGLSDFSLRRAARAAGTTHKVLLYYFASADDLLAQAVLQLRERRTAAGLVAATGGPGPRPLADRVRAVWPILAAEEQRVLDQAIGLALYDPVRHADLGRESSRQYLPALMSICPEHWPRQRQLEVAQLILAAFRGFLIELRTSGDEAGVAAGFEAFIRALEREEAAG
jgi:AcrR family transcriptional regulator